MRRLPRILLVFLVALLGPTLPGQEWTELCERFHGYDRGNDGNAEIISLHAGQTAGETGGHVLVMVEERLWADLEGCPSLSPKIERYCNDLAQEGWRATPIRVELGAQVDHRDGYVLLALREFLQGAAAEQDLAGVVLVGRFPDAFLVRSCNWRKRGALTLHKGTDRERSWKNVEYLRRVPEAVAHRCDIVLADLDGNWESLYVGPRVELPSTHVVFEKGSPKHGGFARDIQQQGIAFQDFFHLADGRLEVAPLQEGGQAWVSVNDLDADLEVPISQRALPNALAQPEIFVSRIDAAGIALTPNPDLRDRQDRAPLDSEGRPQELEFASQEATPSWNSGHLWVRDSKLERELLADFFDRNHAYRTVPQGDAFRPASIAHDLASGYSTVRAASHHWKGLREANANVHASPTLLDFVQWMKLPAVLRTVRAHSDPWGSVFHKGDLEGLDQLFEESALGAPMAWTQQGNRLIPSLTKAAGGGKLDFFLLRSLWEADLLPETSSLFLHTGCHGISPPAAESRSFQHPAYGRRAGGESLLFYGNGLAILGRAKVFYDEPRGFAAELAAGRTIGHAWARYFEVESQSTWSQAGGDIGRKRSYFWSILGDWTLRLHE